MIPWFIVRIVAAIARPFGRTVHVEGRYGCMGVDRIHIVRLPPDTPVLAQLHTLDGEPLVQA